MQCNGRVWLIGRDGFIWDIWWVYCPRCPSYPTSTAMWAMESIISVSTLFTILCLKTSCNWWWLTIWLTNSIDIFAAEAGLEAVASSGIPSKTILSIKALVTDLHTMISAYEIHCCREIRQGLQIRADLVQNMAGWDVKGIHLLHWPPCRISG